MCAVWLCRDFALWTHPLTPKWSESYYYPVDTCPPCRHFAHGLRAAALLRGGAPGLLVLTGPTGASPLLLYPTGFFPPSPTLFLLPSPPSIRMPDFYYPATSDSQTNVSIYLHFSFYFLYSANLLKASTLFARFIHQEVGFSSCCPAFSYV